jgi:hypothetical protein
MIIGVECVWHHDKAATRIARLRSNNSFNVLE